MGERGGGAAPKTLSAQAQELEPQQHPAAAAGGVPTNDHVAAATEIANEIKHAVAAAVAASDRVTDFAAAASRVLAAVPNKDLAAATAISRFSTTKDGLAAITDKRPAALASSATHAHAVSAAGILLGGDGGAIVGGGDGGGGGGGDIVDGGSDV